MCIHAYVCAHSIDCGWKLAGGEVELPEFKQISDLGIIVLPDQLCGTRSLVMLSERLLSFRSHMKPIFSIWPILYSAPLILKIDFILSAFVLACH